jgi:D-inositol-3-phosphate glycosyltransferase
MPLNRVIMISVHSSPLDVLGGKDTGGMNVYIREVSRKLGRRDIKVDIFTLSKNPSFPNIVYLDEGVRVIHLKVGIEGHNDKNILWNYLPDFLEGIFLFVKEFGVTYDLIHSHYWLSGWIANELSKKWEVPTVHMSHTLGFLKNEVAKSDDEKDPCFRLEKEKEVLGAVDRIIATTLHEKTQLITRLGIPQKKVEVIPCGVDIDLFKPWETEEAKYYLGLNGQRFVLFVGRIDPIKGIDNLLQAMSILSKKNKDINGDIKLLIIGGEEENQPLTENHELRSLMRLTSELHLEDQVEFLGTKKQEVLPYYYSSAEVCVLPSRYESFGIVALEAMACGTPIVASNVGGLSQIVGDKKTGFLVPAEDPDIMAERIKWVLAHPDIRNKFGKEAVKWAGRFEWSLVTDKVIHLYSQMVL